MLPIPAPIIGSGSASVNHRRLFTALIYLGATASLCYVFLLALVSEKQSGSSRKKFLISDSSGRSIPGKSDKYHHHHHYERDPLQLEESGNQTHHFVETDKFHFISNTKRHRLKDSEKLALSSSSSTQQTTTQTLHFPRKKLHSLRRKTNQNGAWRSDSAKIWLGHQDLKLRLTKGDVTRNKPSSEVYSYPWSKDEQCKAFKVQFAKKATFKPRALVSFPGSGNSWLRYMIECASGYYTGSVYDDKKLFTAGLLGELRPPNDGSTIVQKTHHDTIYNQPLRQRKAFVKLSELMFGYRGLLLIRNPYDALVSYWNFIKSERSHKGIAKQSEFEDFKWAKFVTDEIPRWTSLIISWLENSQDYLIIFYEDVVKNPRGELIRILEYLDEPVDTRRLDCLMKPENLEGHFHRPHHHQPGANTTSDIPLAVDLIPVTTTSQQHHKNIQVEHQNKESSSHHHDETAGLPLLPLDSKKSQHQQQHPQSPPPPEEEEVGEKEEVEQKEDKFLSPPPPYEPIISSVSSPSKQQQNQYKDNMTSNDNTDQKNHHHHQHEQYHHHSHDSNNHPNNSSILRLDLIIQDNIDKINRFFQQKGIPTQLHYSPRQSTIPFFRRTVQEYDV